MSIADLAHAWGQHYPDYRGKMHRTIADAIEAGNARLVANGRDAAFYTWVRWGNPGPMNRPPKLIDYQCDEGPLFLVDVIGRPGSSGIAIGKMIRDDLRGGGIARTRERVYFWRHRSQRYGAFRMEEFQ